MVSWHLSCELVAGPRAKGPGLGGLARAQGVVSRQCSGIAGFAGEPRSARGGRATGRSYWLVPRVRVFRRRAQERTGVGGRSARPPHRRSENWRSARRPVRGASAGAYGRSSVTPAGRPAGHHLTAALDDTRYPASSNCSLVGADRTRLRPFPTAPSSAQTERASVHSRLLPCRRRARETRLQLFPPIGRLVEAC